MWLCCPMRSRRAVSRTSATLIALAEEEEDEEDEEEAIREVGAVGGGGWWRVGQGHEARAPSHAYNRER